MRSRALACCALVGALTIAAAGCGKRKAGEGEAGPGPLRSGPAATAAVAEVRPEPMDVLYEAVGTVRSKTTSVLSSKVVGNVEAVLVRPGDEVKAGQLLLQVGSRGLAAQLDKARAGLKEAEDAIREVEAFLRASEAAKAAADANRALAKATYERFQTLLERKSVSPQEFDEVQARSKTAIAEADRADEMLQAARAKKNQVLARQEQARAEVADAEAHFNDTQIKAPISGLVTKKNVDAGDQAAPGAPLLTVEDNRNYRLEVAAEERLAAHIHVGDAATVTIDALGGVLQGTVAEIIPTADPASRSFLVKLDLPMQQESRAGAPGDLRSGMYGRAAFAVGKRQAVTLPASAFAERGELVYVYSVDSNNIAHLRLVKTGRRYGDRVEVLSGLRAGERVVVEKTGPVQDGSPIQSGSAERPY